MKRALAALIVFAGICLLMASQRLQSRPAEWDLPAAEKEVTAVHAQMQAAAEALDADALYAHVLDTQTFPIVEDGQLRKTHGQALQSTRRGFEGITQLRYRYADKQVVVVSTSSALWIASGTASATLADGRTITADFAESIVFVQSDGKWKVLHAHRSVPNAP
jgi:ketosteroid isomerase-like protein